MSAPGRERAIGRRDGFDPAPVRRWCPAGAADDFRNIPEEVPVAIVYQGATYAVMMASPGDLVDFAIGFTLTEAVARPGEIEEIEVTEQDNGIQVRIWLTTERAEAVRGRARRLAGPVGCGLCGVESLAEASRPVIPVSAPGPSLFPRHILDAMEALAPNQPLHLATRSTHAAAFWHPRQGLVAVREDVGRHNALDKLIGALARCQTRDGAVLLTSRVSVEMVQKTASADIPVIVAVSAPTALAVQLAEKSGVTLVAVARADGFEVFTHPHRIAQPPDANYASA